MLSQLTSPEILIHGLLFLISLLCWRETWVIMMFVLIQEVFPVSLFARKHIGGKYLPLLFFLSCRDQARNAMSLCSLLEDLYPVQVDKHIMIIQHSLAFSERCFPCSVSSSSSWPPEPLAPFTLQKLESFVQPLLVSGLSSLTCSDTIQLFHLPLHFLFLSLVLPILNLTQQCTLDSKPKKNSCTYYLVLQLLLLNTVPFFPFPPMV